MKSKFLLSLLAPLLLAPLPLFAQSATAEDAAKEKAAQELAAATAGSAAVKEAAPQAGEWKTNAGLSGLINTGNSSNQTIGGNALVSYKWLRNKLEGTGNGAYGRAEDPKTRVTSVNTKNWRAALRYDRYLLDPLSLFALGHIGADQPAGFDLRYGGAAGLAHEIYKTDPHFFKYEVGLDYARELRVEPNPDFNLYAARLYLKYQYKITSVSSFAQDAEFLFNLKTKQDVRINTLTALLFKMTEILSFQAGYGVRYDHQPVPGKKKTDTTTQLGLVANIL